MKASDKSSKAKAEDKAPEKHTPTKAENLAATLDRVEREIQSLNTQFVDIDDETKAGLTTDQLFKIERLAALGDRSKAGTDALAAPANTIPPVAPTSQPPVHRFVHGEPAATEVVKNAESEEAARISRGEEVPRK